MRSVVFLILACLVIAGPVTAVSIEASSASCTDDTYPGLPGGTGIAVVEVSGHGDTRIDGVLVEPAGTGMYKGYSTRWYGATDGSHMVYITREGFLPYTSYISACTGKVSYVYYDQAAHPYPGMPVSVTATTAVPVTTTVIPTTMYGGESADLKAALAGKTVAPGSLGSLSITTDPAGATVYIDGVRQGVSPATIPGIAQGSHTLTLKLEGYEDLTLPVSITAGSTQYYSSALKKSGAVAAPATTTRKSSAPGFEAAVVACVAGALLLFRKTRP